jgi:hypothetical protein
MRSTQTSNTNTEGNIFYQAYSYVSNMLSGFGSYLSGSSAATPAQTPPVAANQATNNTQAPVPAQTAPVSLSAPLPVTPVPQNAATQNEATSSNASSVAAITARFNQAATQNKQPTAERKPSQTAPTRTFKPDTSPYTAADLHQQRAMEAIQRRREEEARAKRQAELETLAALKRGPGHP